MSFTVSSSSWAVGARSQFAGARLNNARRGRVAAAETPAPRKSRSLRVTAAMRPYTVRKGDTLTTIASKRGMSVEEIRKCNAGRVMDSEVKVGETILLPAGKLSKRDGEIIEGGGVPISFHFYFFPFLRHDEKEKRGDGDKEILLPLPRSCL